MRAQVLVTTALTAFLASCIDYTGLGEGGERYTTLGEADAGSVFVDASRGDSKGVCEPAGATTCTAASCDDGASTSATLVSGSYDCAYQAAGSNWAGATNDCAALGPAYRLPTKIEALRIASNAGICKTLPPSTWGSWTSTCAGAGTAWRLLLDGSAVQARVEDSSYALCVRPSDSCSPLCPNTCRMSATSDGCGGTCAANCATSCSTGVCIVSDQASGIGVGDGGAKTCVSAATDEGVVAASTLAIASRDCAYLTTASDWASALNLCAALGADYRLPTKGEVLKIVSVPTICRSSLPAGWFTWTSTCASSGQAWSATGTGTSARNNVTDTKPSLCIR